MRWLVAAAAGSVAVATAGCGTSARQAWLPESRLVEPEEGWSIRYASSLHAAVTTGGLADARRLVLSNRPGLRAITEPFDPRGVVLEFERVERSALFEHPRTGSYVEVVSLVAGAEPLEEEISNDTRFPLAPRRFRAFTGLHARPYPRVLRLQVGGVTFAAVLRYGEAAPAAVRSAVERALRSLRFRPLREGMLVAEEYEILGLAREYRPGSVTRHESVRGGRYYLLRRGSSFSAVAKPFGKGLGRCPLVFRARTRTFVCGTATWRSDGASLADGPDLARARGFVTYDGHVAVHLGYSFAGLPLEGRAASTLAVAR